MTFLNAEPQPMAITDLSTGAVVEADEPLASTSPRLFTGFTLRSLLIPHRLGLIGVMLISIFANFWMLGQNGYGNLYYAAAVKSMGNNWKAFFFVSFDATGFVTVDKPPVGFWLQVISTKIFGFTPFAVFLPQALAGVLSVLLLYWLVRRHFGVIAGLIAAVALAVSPISVVTNRNNTIDSTLMLVLLLAAWATFRAIETDKLRWLVVSGLLIGLGFNIKMMEAYLPIPAFTLAYLFSSRKSWVRRIAHLVGAGAVMVALSFLWVAIVDLIPASLRPWVGSTSDNSELTLALGYNGVQRLLGMGGGNFSGRTGSAPTTGATGRVFPGGAPGAGGPPPNFAGGPPPSFGQNGGARGPRGGFGAGARGGFGGGGGMFNTGNPGVLRLFTEPLGGQIVWLLPLALISIVAVAVARPFRPREDRQHQSLLLWGTWLLTTTVFFSIAGFFHQYYLSQMALAIAAMAGIGIVTLWGQFHAPGWRGWLLPFALLVTAIEQVYIITSNPSWGAWLIPVVMIPTTLAATALVALRLWPNALTFAWEGLSRVGMDARTLLGRSAVTVGLLALLAVPTFWSLEPAVTNTVSDLPTAGATTMVGNADPTSQSNSKLISYLETHQGTATYLVATPSSNAADVIILATGKPVMALGGFTGSDPILTVTQLKTLISKGEIRYFLLNGGNTRASISSGGSASDSVINVGGPDGSSNSTVQWVEQNCSTIPTREWQSAGATSNQQLYVCTAG
ncbi:MAG TPA: glycosyltransferase family 39 protein [Ktedonobacterales bacterium]